jgi:hypothetical protein
MSTARKSDIKHPAAKRFMVVFVVVMLIGITIDSVHRSDAGDWTVAAGFIGFLASALIASEKKSDTPNVPSNSTKTTSSSRSSTDNVMAEAGGCLVLLLFVAVIGAFLWFILPDSWTDKIRYSAEYSVEMSQVERHDPPTDCDFMTAPLGRKNCHYKKTVAAYNAQNLQVAGDDAPRYSSDTNTHRPIVSYDNGKTWDWVPEETKTVNLKVTKVIVDWVKVSGE